MATATSSTSSTHLWDKCLRMCSVPSTVHAIALCVLQIVHWFILCVVFSGSCWFQLWSIALSGCFTRCIATCWCTAGTQSLLVSMTWRTSRWPFYDFNHLFFSLPSGIMLFLISFSSLCSARVYRLRLWPISCCHLRQTSQLSQSLTKSVTSYPPLLIIHAHFLLHR